MKSHKTILDKYGNVVRVKKIAYPSVQYVRILTIHLRRWHVPRQVNIHSKKLVRAKLYSEGDFSKHFKQHVLQAAVDATMLCRHCIRGAWVYIRVGDMTHTVWLKGEGEDMSYITPPKTIEFGGLHV